MTSHQRRVGLDAINLLAISLGRSCHIGGVLETALNLETGNSQLNQTRNLKPRGKVLRREQITLIPEIQLFAIHNHLIGQAAGLGAFATVRTALA